MVETRLQNSFWVKCRVTSKVNSIQNKLNSPRSTAVPWQESECFAVFAEFQHNKANFYYEEFESVLVLNVFFPLCSRHVRQNHRPSLSKRKPRRTSCKSWLPLCGIHWLKRDWSTLTLHRSARHLLRLAHHHQAVQYRRTQIQGSDSSDEDEFDEDEEADDIEWGPATEL